MTTPAPRGVRPGGILAALLGVGRVARGRVDGIALFDNTPRGFSASLAPVLAFSFVGTALLLAHGDGVGAVTGLAATLVMLLTPLVLSEWLAARWDRREAWLRYAIAFNWCQWAMPPAFVVGLLFAGVLMGFGLPQELAGHTVLAVVLVFGLWLEWFVARHALGISRRRAVVLVGLINVATAVLVLVPGMIADAVTG